MSSRTGLLLWVPLRSSPFDTPVTQNSGHGLLYGVSCTIELLLFANDHTPNSATSPGRLRAGERKVGDDLTHRRRRSACASPVPTMRRYPSCDFTRQAARTHARGARNGPPKGRHSPEGGRELRGPAGAPPVGSPWSFSGLRVFSESRGEFGGFWRMRTRTKNKFPE